MAENSIIDINQQSFVAGQSLDPKLAVANSYYQSIALDNRSLPSQISVLPGPQNISNSLGGLITAMEQDLNGVRWGSGVDGGIYKIDTSDVVTPIDTMTEAGSAGMLYSQVTDQLYIPGQTMVSMYGQVTTGNPGQPVFRSNQFAQSASTANGCVNLFTSTGFFDGSARNNSQSLATGITENTVIGGSVVTNSTNTYSVPTTVTLTPTTQCPFSPDIEPFYSIMVYIKAKGTGDWTLTLYNQLQIVIATVTVTNANLTSGAYNKFAFGKQVRALVNASQTGTSGTYSWVVTSTVADGTVGTLTSGDLSTADFLLFAYRLVQTHNGWHPTAYFNGAGFGALCIGNGQYLSLYNFGNDSNPTNYQWVRHFLTFKQGYEVCGITTNNQYLIIACERRSNEPTRNAQDGCLYFWDGTTNAPAMFIDVPMGSPYEIYTANNVTYFTCAGSLFAWSGGQTVIKVRKLAYQQTDYLGAVDSTITNPNMMAMRYNVLMIGYPSSTTNINLNYGVYSWGTVELTFPNSLALSYLLANQYMNNTGSISNLQIGCVYNFVDAMYISWSYTDASSVTHYGMDRLNNSSPSAPAFSFTSLIYDGGSVYKIKEGLRVKLTTLALPAGYTINMWYSLDRGTKVFPTGATLGTGSTGATLDINQRYHEVQYGFTGTSTGVNSPAVVLGITHQLDTLPREQNLIASQ